jgi:hypothetical protein
LECGRGSYRFPNRQHANTHTHAIITERIDRRGRRRRPNRQLRGRTPNALRAIAFAAPPLLERGRGSYRFPKGLSPLDRNHPATCRTAGPLAPPRATASRSHSKCAPRNRVCGVAAFGVRSRQLPLSQSPTPQYSHARNHCGAYRSAGPLAPPKATASRSHSKCAPRNRVCGGAAFGVRSRQPPLLEFPHLQGQNSDETPPTKSHVVVEPQRGEITKPRLKAWANGTQSRSHHPRPSNYGRPLRI